MLCVGPNRASSVPSTDTGADPGVSLMGCRGKEAPRNFGKDKINVACIK